MCLAYQQGKVFWRFREKEKFITVVKEFKFNKSTMIFKISIVKWISKDSRLMKSSVALKLLKRYFSDIKDIYNENLSESNGQEICLNYIYFVKANYFS